MRRFARLRVAAFLAGRSLRRGNVGVTAMSVVMMAVVFISVSFLPSLINGAVAAINEQVTSTLTGDLSITAAKSTTITDAGDYLQRIRSVSGVTAATGVRRVGTQVAFGDRSNAWGVDAIDPRSFARVFSTPKHLIEGTFLSEGDTDGIVLGVDIAGADQTRLRSYSTSLQTVHAGDRVQVSLLGGVIHDFVVRGIYENHFPLSDQGAYITIAGADALIPTTDYAATVTQMFGAIDELTAALGTAADQAGRLADGSSALAAGADRLAANVSALESGASRLNSSAAQLLAAAAQLDDSTGQLATSAGQLASGVATLASQLTTTVAPAAHAGADAAVAAAGQEAALVSSCPVASDPVFCSELSANASAASVSASSFQVTASTVDAVATSVHAAAASASALSSGLGALHTGVGTVVDAARGLASGATASDSAARQLSTAAGGVAASARTIAQASQQLAQGLQQGSAGIPKIATKDRDALVELLRKSAEIPAKDTVTRIVVRTGAGVSASRVTAGLRPLRSGVQFQTPAQLAAAIQDQVETFDLIDRIMRVISLLVAAITVFIITYVDLTNRRRQIGIERAIGISSGSIVGSYVLKSMATAAVGTVIGGLVFRFALVPLVDRYPFVFPTGPVSLVTDATTTVETILILLGVAAVSAMVPAIRIVTMRILDAIWGS